MKKMFFFEPTFGIYYIKFFFNIISKKLLF
uniref:Uncharacterized protein n=1 Tax=viral metagenome TaxID=1070528 RepID=A0A6C0ADA4_9ZZZZ